MIENYKEIIKIGVIFKNYKTLAITLNEKVKEGRGKKFQVLDWKRYFDFIVKGQKIEIIEVYEFPKPKINNRGKSIGSRGNRYEPVKDKNFLIDEATSLKTGVYLIKLNNLVYIGSTAVSFKQRYKQHKQNTGNKMPHTYELLKNGATFSTLWIAQDNNDEELIRKTEQYYIDQYENDPSFILVNKRNELITRTLKKKPKKQVKYINVVNSNNEYSYLKINKEDLMQVRELLSNNCINFTVSTSYKQAQVS